MSYRMAQWRVSALKAGLIMAGLTLSACSQTPVIVPEIIRQPVYIPIPATLTAPVSVNLGQNPTWGSALGAYNEALQTCNASLNAIKSLKSPTPLPDKGSDKPPYK